MGIGIIIGIGDEILLVLSVLVLVIVRGWGGMAWHGIGRDKMEIDGGGGLGLGWDRMEWNGMVIKYSIFC